MVRQMSPNSYVRGIMAAMVQALVFAVRGSRSGSRVPVRAGGSEGFIGAPRLTRDHKGDALCVACSLCSAACPSHCISVVAGERGEGGEVRRVPVRFELDLARCILCGLCVEACPHEAIEMASGQAMPIGRGTDPLLFDKEALLTRLPD